MNTKIMALINSGQRLDTSFYCRATSMVAQDLLGTVFIRHINGMMLAARIVETEAYLAETDEASHSFGGRTKRNASMFERGGVLYVYKIYGIHHCINVATEEQGKGCAVLLRAMEPIAGIPQMQAARGKKPLHKLCQGPGNLAKAFGFTIADDACPLDSDTTYLIHQSLKKTECIIVTPRIGISKALDKPLRFLIKTNPCVSRPYG